MVALGDGVVENVGFVKLVVVKLPLFAGMFGTDVVRVNGFPGVKKLRICPQIPGLEVDGVTEVGWVKSLVGAGLFDVGPTNGVVAAKA